MCLEHLVSAPLFGSSVTAWRYLYAGVGAGAWNACSLIGPHAGYSQGTRMLPPPENGCLSSLGMAWLIRRRVGGRRGTDTAAAAALARGIPFPTPLLLPNGLETANLDTG